MRDGSRITGVDLLNASQLVARAPVVATRPTAMPGCVGSYASGVDVLQFVKAK